MAPNTELDSDERPLPLQFVTYSPDSAPRTGLELRVAVRAQATRWQHRQQRQTDPFRPMTGTRPEPSATKDYASSRSNPRAKRARKSLSSKAFEISHFSTSSAISQSLSKSPCLGSPEEDPFWTFPVDYSPLFPPIISYYIKNLAMPVTELDGPTQKGLLRTHWFPMAMASPATMYAILLMSASHLFRALPGNISNRKRSATGTDNLSSRAIRLQDILVLKARALNEINQSLKSNDIQVAVGDTTIGAVAKLAAFEAVFGEKDEYRKHMLGLMRMLQVRRTLEQEMGPLNDFLARLVVWIDVNAAHFTGTKKLLKNGEDSFPVDVEIKEPDPLLFAGTTRSRSDFIALADC